CRGGDMSLEIVFVQVKAYLAGEHARLGDAAGYPHACLRGRARLDQVCAGIDQGLRAGALQSRRRCRTFDQACASGNFVIPITGVGLQLFRSRKFIDESPGPALQVAESPWSIAQLLLAASAWPGD